MNNQKQFRLSVVLLLVVTISIVLSFGGSAKAATSDVLDQEQTSYSGNVWVNSDYPRYQTFTPFYSGQLSKIDICIFDSMSSPGALKVSIYNEGDLSTPLGSVQLASFGSGWTSVDFSSILPYLTRETMYRMVVSTEYGGGAGFGWFTSHNDAYSRGYSPANGSDFAFKTYMIPDYALSPAESQVTINNTSLVADGTSQTTVTIQLKDAQGNNITTGGETVTIASSVGTVSAVTDHNNGSYTATLTAPTTIGTGSINASVGGRTIPTTASVQFVSGPPSLAKSTVTVNDSSLLADGTSQTTVTVKLKDAQGNDVTTGGATVSISSTLGIIGTVTTHNNGTYTATLTAPSTVGTSILSATVNGNAIAATTSVQFIPKPAQTVVASVASNTPTVGSNNMITLSVKNALGDIDTTFNGIKNVTILGYNQAPNGSFGNVNGEPLTSSSQVVAIGFTNGIATANLKLNAATTQSIEFSVLGVNTASSNSVTITPVAGSAASMKVTTALKAPTMNGGLFSQQPVVTLYDAYENVSVNDYTKIITVAKKDAGAWTLTGTLTAKANAGIVSFSDLGSVNSANVSGAQLSFDATGLGQITSSGVTLLPKQLTVSFDATGGSPVGDLTISYDEKINAPTTPSKTGYTFAGWYKDATLTSEWDFAAESVTEDTTLYGKWDANSYTMTFHTNGGTAVAPTSATYGEKATAPTAPTKTGYTFAGWYKDATLTSEWDFAAETVTEDTTLYGKWDANSYTMTFHTNGGTAVAPILATYGEKATAPTAPTKTGYTFAGWYKDATLTTEWNFATETVTEDTTLYGKWAINSYTVTFNTNGGTTVAPVTITYDKKITKPAAPTKVGHTFAGWYKSDTLTTQWDFLIDVVTKDTALYAKWFVNSSSGSDGQSSTPTTPSVPENPKTPSKEPSNPVETPHTEPSKPETEAQDIIFSDVPKTHWAWEMIQDMTRKGIITGYPDKTFRPNDYIKRQHIAIMFTRAFELEAIRETVSFKDVLPSHPYYEAITKLYQAGIVDGSNGEFHPDAFLTRAQMAKVLVEALQLTPNGISHFKDVPPTHWSYNYIATLQQEGIALGDDGYFKPNDPLTRAQFVALMYRAMNR
ncbi:InlB B-repeat-containing protein [Lysinibacillus sphaericus]|uniref:InlB B-repeat-containing protein n=1 Tax=Lysinibacillus sphaericus TaxID=1421 RepID=UPI003D710488